MTMYVVKVFCMVGPSVLAYGMGFNEREARDERAEAFFNAMNSGLRAEVTLFNVEHVGGSCMFYGHQICGVVCEELSAAMPEELSKAMLGGGIVH